MEMIYCGIAVFSVSFLVQQSQRVVVTSKAIGAAVSIFVGLYFLFIGIAVFISKNRITQ